MVIDYDNIAVSDIIDNIRNIIISKAKKSVVVPSIGIIAPSEGFALSTLFLALSCFNNISMFDDDDKDMLYQIYTKLLAL